MSSSQLTLAFFVAVVVILVCSGLLARLARLVGQPPVVAEMIAGIVLGPSVLGLLAPSLEAAVFPAALRPTLYVAGQIGIVAFMFRAGLEFRVDEFRRAARSTGSVSVVGIALPLALGATALAVSPRSLGLYPLGVPTPVVAAFVGVTLAVTAFPMLARIIAERGLGGTRIGTLALSAGALDDVVAWVLLAGVLGLKAGTLVPILVAVGGALVFVGVLVLVRRWADRTGRVARWLDQHPVDGLLVVVTGSAFLAASFTDGIGLHAVIGAFSLGVACPRHPRLLRAMEGSRVISLVFLPLFFTSSGLNTNITLLFQPELLLFTAVVIGCAVLGKFGGCWAAARLCGEPNDVAISIGALMNTRGLMQLIAIDVGLTAGIVAPPLFTVLVVVAVVTTLMASPVLALVRRRAGRAPDDGTTDGTDPRSSRGRAARDRS
ncbi:cation:proton antiporter [Amycolatopsis sp. H6(2020)]|nr:cation:proton antiporter [Amycolatopsis sp. H6(2020)]